VQAPPSVLQVRSIPCGVVRLHIQARGCIVRRTCPPSARIRAVCAPTTRARQHAVSLAVYIQSRKLALGAATLSITHRVLLSRHRAAVRACVRLLPKRVASRTAPAGWRCRARRVTVERFRCRSMSSSLAWRLPVARYALPVERLPLEHRRQCQDALQRVAKGYARVQSVYYPIPAHAVARIEIDERRGILYLHLRKGRAEGTAPCLWVVSGQRLADEQPVRALLKGG